MEELIPHEKLKRIRLILYGVSTFYDLDGDQIIAILRRQQKDELISSMETIGAALYWLRNQIEAQLREAEANEKA